jgi:Ca-activated chloride channel family protein
VGKTNAGFAVLFVGLLVAPLALLPEGCATKGEQDRPRAATTSAAAPVSEQAASPAGQAADVSAPMPLAARPLKEAAEPDKALGFEISRGATRVVAGAPAGARTMVPAALPPVSAAVPRQTATGASPFGGAATRALPASRPAAVQNPNLYVNNTYLGGSGSRDRMETLITNGVLVQGKRVKLDAFSRTYAQTFPIPTTEALSVSADTERTKIVTQGGRTFLQVGLQAIKGEAPRRPPLNVALVLDVSGSMHDENKLGHAKAAALDLVGRLRAQDTVSLVVFDDHARVLQPASRRPAASRRACETRSPPFSRAAAPTSSTACNRVTPRRKNGPRKRAASASCCC